MNNPPPSYLTATCEVTVLQHLQLSHRELMTIKLLKKIPCPRVPDLYRVVTAVSGWVKGVKKQLDQFLITILSRWSHR